MYYMLMLSQGVWCVYTPLLSTGLSQKCLSLPLNASTATKWKWFFLSSLDKDLFTQQVTGFNTDT